MKIAVVIPDRGDRPAFIGNCMRMIRLQSAYMENDITIFHVDFAPAADGQKDITKRYRSGYEAVNKSGDFNLIFFMENDDWYHEDYMHEMILAWINHDQPDIFGTNYTIYYHLQLKKWFIMNHPERASAMNTLIKPGLNIQWPADNEPYTDLHLWMKCGLNGVTWNPGRIISIGMKHGVGLCGGVNHTDHLHRFINTDPSSDLLRLVMDEDSYDFYTQIAG